MSFVIRQCVRSDFDKIYAELEHHSIQSVGVPRDFWDDRRIGEKAIAVHAERNAYFWSLPSVRDNCSDRFNLGLDGNTFILERIGYCRFIFTDSSSVEEDIVRQAQNAAADALRAGGLRIECFGPARDTDSVHDAQFPANRWDCE